MNNKYITVQNEAHIKHKVGACRFYGSVKSINSEQEAFQFIERIRALYPDATHHVWAFKVGLGFNTLCRNSDDGEPANSSGPPIAKVIDGSGLTNIVIVVTRYYGGVNQGYGGLIRAYSGTASIVLSEAGVIEHEIFQTIHIKPVAYADLGNIIRHVEASKGKIKNINYGEEVEVVAILRPSLLKDFNNIVRDATRGKAKLSLGEYLWQQV